MAISHIGTTAVKTGVNTTATLNFDKDASALTNDVIVLWVASRPQDATSGITYSIPGFTLVEDEVDVASANSRSQLTLYYHVVTSSTPSTYTITASPAPAGRISAVASTYRGVDTTSPISASNLLAWESPSATTHSIAITTPTSGWISNAHTNIGDDTFTGADTLRGQTTLSSNANLWVGDTNAAVAAGSYTKNVTHTVSTSVGISGAAAIQAAATIVAPTIVSSAGLGYSIDATASTPGQGGALTFSMAKVSGTTLTFTETSEGVFRFTPGAGSAVYRLTATEAGGTTKTQDYTIPAEVVAAPAGDTYYSETLVRVGGVWT